MITGISTASLFPRLACEEAVTKLGQLGIRNIEVFFSTLSEYKKDFILEVKSRADEYGTSVYSVHALSLQFEPQLFSQHERSRQDSLDIYEQVLCAGAELGAKVYVMHGPAHVKRAVPLNLNYEYVAERVLPLCEMAQSYGINLTWENVHWCWYAQPEFPKKLGEYLGDAPLYYTLDIKQAAQSGYDPVVYAVHAADMLKNVHICDYINTADKGVVPAMPFSGETDFERLKKTLSDSCYDEAVMLEVYGHNYYDYDELLENYRRINTLFCSRRA